jgi:putative transposase
MMDVPHRPQEWTESVAVGSKTFIEGIREKLQPGLRGRKMRETSGHYELREKVAAYSVNFAPKNVLLSTENTYILDLNVE